MTIKYITCGTLIDGTGAAPKPEMVLKLEGKRITSVDPKAATEIPPDAEHLDLSTFTVLPGLVECEGLSRPGFWWRPGSSRRIASLPGDQRRSLWPRPAQGRHYNVSKTFMRITVST